MSKLSAKRSILANAGWLGIERLVRSATALFVVVWIARYLGPEQFGLLNYAQSLAYAFYPIATFGLAGVLVKDLVQHPNSRDLLQSAGMLIRFCGGILAVILCLLLASLLGNGDLVLMVGIIALAFLCTPADAFDAELQAHMNNREAVLVKLLVFAASTLFKVLVIILGASVYWFAGVMTLEVVLIGLAMAFLVLKLYGMWVFRIDPSAVMALLRQGWPMLFLALLGGIYLRIDQILLGALSGYEHVGEYAAAWKLVEAGSYVPNILLASLAPVLAAHYAESKELYRSRYAVGFRWVFWVVLIGCSTVFILAPWLVDLLFKHQYLQAATILRVLVWSVLLMVFNLFAMQWAINHQKGRVVWEMTLVGLLSCVGLSFILVPMYSGLGAATAVVCSQIIGYIIYGWCRPEGRKILRIQFKAIGSFKKLEARA